MEHLIPGKNDLDFISGNVIVMLGVRFQKFDLKCVLKMRMINALSLRFFIRWPLTKKSAKCEFDGANRELHPVGIQV